MKTTAIATYETSTAAELAEFISSLTDPRTVYVQDEQGNEFTKATLVSEKLSDGSEVFNLILHR